LELLKATASVYAAKHRFAVGGCYSADTLLLTIEMDDDDVEVEMIAAR
jgi:hypothetical protein